MLRNLRDAWSWIEKLIRRIERLESGAFLENSSITGGRLRLIGGLLLIDSGGTLQVVGNLNGDGTFAWTGSAAFNGPLVLTGDTDITGSLDVDGPTNVNGPWKLVGNGDIAGNVGITGILTLLSELVVKSAGKITVEGADGPTVLQNSRLKLSNGAELKANGSGVALIGGTASASVSPGIARLMNNGSGKGFESDGFYAGPRIVGMPTRTSATSGGLPAGAVYADSSGVLYRVVP